MEDNSLYWLNGTLMCHYLLTQEILYSTCTAVGL